MNRNRFLELEAEIKGIIGESFAKAIKKRPSDFVLLISFFDAIWKVNEHLIGVWKIRVNL